MGHLQRRHFWPYTIICMLLVGTVAIVLIGSRHIFQADTKLTQSSPHIGTVSLTTTPMQHVSERYFTLNIPVGWYAVAPPNVPYTVYSWQGTKTDSARRLDIYWGTIPISLAVNRLLPVTSTGAGISMTGPVSDNCVNFTDKETASLATGAAPARWNGVNFLCDVDNYERDVVGSGSTEGINILTVTGDAFGQHRVLLVYTDNSANPDYTIFEDMVRSFQAR